MSASRKNYKKTTKKMNYKRKEGYNSSKAPTKLAVRKYLAIEKKDATLTFALTPAGANLWSPGVLLNQIPQGPTQQQHIGRKVMMKSLYIRYVMTDVVGDTAYGRGRILVVYDKQTNGQPPLITDVLATNGFNSPNALTNADRFITIMDVLTDAPQSAGQFVAGAEYRSIGLDTMFNAGTTGVVGDISSGSVYCFYCNADGAVSSNINIVSRIRFTDI